MRWSAFSVTFVLTISRGRKNYIYEMNQTFLLTIFESGSNAV